MEHCVHVWFSLCSGRWNMSVNFEKFAHVLFLISSVAESSFFTNNCINIFFHTFVFLQTCFLCCSLSCFMLICHLLHCLHSVFIHLVSTSVSAVGTSVSPTHTHGHGHGPTQPCSLSVTCLCSFFFFFFSCFSHLCSCHVLVPVHQWASVLSTRSPWPKMSEQAAARQVHCAAGLCFTSSHPCTSCSVMLTVIESTQAAASERGRREGPCAFFYRVEFLQFGQSLLCLQTWLFSGFFFFLGGGRWQLKKEVLCCALGAASSTLLC